MLLVHLFVVYFACVEFCPSSLPLGVGGWLRLVTLEFSYFFFFVIFCVSCLGNKTWLQSGFTLFKNETESFSVFLVLNLTSGINLFLGI